MILVTGAAGFIGSNIVSSLNKKGFHNIIICDWLDHISKRNNLNKLIYDNIISPENIFKYLNKNDNIELVIHMGANSSTTETNFRLIYNFNTRFSRNLWKWCTQNKVRFIYASSAATYGDGSKGFDDSENKIYQPLNIYGLSKYLFDRYAIKQAKKYLCPPQWVGLKFFNVYGPNEYHKGSMQSVIKHSLDQYNKTGIVKLFKSYNDKFKNGQQTRDFIYVDDCVSLINWFLENKNISGIFNCGTGIERSFEDLVTSMFKAINVPPKIKYIEMPENIKHQYQYYTRANMKKVIDKGYKIKALTLEEGVYDYVTNYLLSNDKYK
ncbi:MAG: ADP-glyceromanno-heptose 6-epimerase [Pelagibacterales bacterium]|nr:ADP-glyceromanno-heptose 6-epimerase [Pelagibacterales bacterium]|tara:strand:- start:3628 stop:4596 length:969 start_codon:yes stop_codon:yes gene_type:complete